MVLLSPCGESRYQAMTAESEENFSLLNCHVQPVVYRATSTIVTSMPFADMPQLDNGERQLAYVQDIQGKRWAESVMGVEEDMHQVNRSRESTDEGDRNNINNIISFRPEI